MLGPIIPGIPQKTIDKLWNVLYLNTRLPVVLISVSWKIVDTEGLPKKFLHTIILNY